MSDSRRRLILALDFGTSSAKAALFDVDGARVVTIRRPLTLRARPHGGVEQSPHELLRAARSLVSEIGARLRARDEITAAGIACQRSSIVIWDRATRRAIGPIVSWMDRRAAPRMAAMDGARRMVARRSGLRLSAHYGAAHLFRRLREDPALARAARRGTVVAGPVASFVVDVLTGNGPVACDPTLAQRMLLYDPWRQRWDDALCALFGVPAAVLPEIRPVASDWGTLPVGRRLVPLRALAGDQQAAAAAFDLRPGTAGALINYGTGAFALWPAPRSRAAAAGLLLSARADRPGGFYLEGTVNTAGAALDALARWIGRAAVRQGLSHLPASAPRSDLPLLVPAFAGLGAPHWDEAARPVLVCGGSDRSARSLVLATLAGIAHRVTDILEASAPGGALILSGPLASIPALVRLQCELSGRAVRTASEPEATLLGIARIASRARGGDPLPPAATGREQTPRLPKVLRRDLRESWNRALEASRGP